MAEVVLEVSDSQNGSLVFGPTSERLRGRWDRANIPGTSMDEALEALSSILVLPGIRISIDTHARRIRRYDPLGTKEFESVLLAVNKVAKTYPYLFSSTAVAAWPEMVIEDATDNQLKDWLYWARVALDHKSMVIVSGRMPSMDEIKAMPGKRRRLYGTNKPFAEADFWADEVEVHDSGKQGQGRQQQNPKQAA